MYNTEDITLEKVDIIRERTGANYEEAKVALEVSSGDILEAIVYIEREKKLSSKEIYSSIDDTMDTVKGILKKGNLTKIKITSGDKKLIEMPLTAGVFGVVGGYIFLAGPLFIALAGLSVGAMTNKIRIEVTKEDGTVQVVNKILKDAGDTVKDKMNTPEIKNKVDVATKTVKDATKSVKDSAQKITKNVKGKADGLTKGMKKKKPENLSYTVNFDEEEEN